MCYQNVLSKEKSCLTFEIQALSDATKTTTDRVAYLSARLRESGVQDDSQANRTAQRRVARMILDTLCARREHIERLDASLKSCCDGSRP